MSFSSFSSILCFIFGHAWHIEAIRRVDADRNNDLVLSTTVCSRCGERHRQYTTLTKIEMEGFGAR